MNRKEHLLTCLAEECAEVAQRADKALRFGMYERRVEEGVDGYTNETKIVAELNDLIGVLELLGIDQHPLLGDRAATEAKKKKVEDHLIYAHDQGTLKEW